MGKPYTGKADVYSFGVICWESIARKRFFEEISFMRYPPPKRPHTIHHHRLSRRFSSRVRYAARVVSCGAMTTTV